jgi:hypothetical protein
MSFSANALVPTKSGSKYMQQLCKHWAHNLNVDFDATKGTVIFPKDARGANWPAQGVVTMTAQDEGLACRIDASTPQQLDGLKGALARHLDRFAFREAPLTFNWANVD